MNLAEALEQVRDGGTLERKASLKAKVGHGHSHGGDEEQSPKPPAIILFLLSRRTGAPVHNISHQIPLIFLASLGLFGFFISGPVLTTMGPPQLVSFTRQRI